MSVSTFVANWVEFTGEIGSLYWGDLESPGGQSLSRSSGTGIKLIVNSPEPGIGEMSRAAAYFDLTDPATGDPADPGWTVSAVTLQAENTDGDGMRGIGAAFVEATFASDAETVWDATGSSGTSADNFFPSDQYAPDAGGAQPEEYGGSAPNIGAFIAGSNTDLMIVLYFSNEATDGLITFDPAEPMTLSITYTAGATTPTKSMAYRQRRVA